MALSIVFFILADQRIKLQDRGGVLNCMNFVVFLNYHNIIQIINSNISCFHKIFLSVRIDDIISFLQLKKVHYFWWIYHCKQGFFNTAHPEGKRKLWNSVFSRFSSCFWITSQLSPESSPVKGIFKWAKLYNTPSHFYAPTWVYRFVAQ